MDNTIKRTIRAMSNYPIEPISTVYGSDMLPIELTYSDFTIPTGATATAYAQLGGYGEVYPLTATISGNAVIVAPVPGAFQPGRNRLQVEIANGGKTLVQFAIQINCGNQLSSGEIVPPATVKTWAQQAAESNDAAQAAKTAAEAAAAGIDEKLEEFSEMAITSSSRIILSQEDAVREFNADIDNTPINSIYVIGSSSVSISNKPDFGLFTILTYNGVVSNRNGIVQVAVSNKGNVAWRMHFKNTWTDWIYENRYKEELQDSLFNGLYEFDGRVFSRTEKVTFQNGFVDNGGLHSNAKVLSSVQRFTAPCAISNPQGLYFRIVKYEDGEYSTLWNGGTSPVTNDLLTSRLFDDKFSVIKSAGEYAITAVCTRGSIAKEITPDDCSMSVLALSTYSHAITGNGTMITNNSQLSEIIGGDLNNCSANSVITIGATLPSLQHAPHDGFVGSVLTASYSRYSKSGAFQACVDKNGKLFSRIFFGGSWSAWTSDSDAVYYVGRSRDHTSLTELFMDLADDATPKTIYVDPGEYDIYAEYMSEDRISKTVPHDIASSDYLGRCAFVPKNTKLIGIGNVILNWDPVANDDATADVSTSDAISYGAARTWSPINVKWACHIENIEIRCHNGRYCIHDDSHNAADDRGVTHSYRNVRCIYTYSDNMFGFNDVIGFGFSQKNTIIFDDCYLEMRNGGNNAVFYGHSYSGTALLESESPSIIARNCIFKGGGNRTVRLQSLNRSSLKCNTLFAGCYIDGGVQLTKYYEDSRQAFSMRLLKSGNPAITIDDPNNQWPVEIFA